MTSLQAAVQNGSGLGLTERRQIYWQVYESLDHLEEDFYILIIEETVQLATR